MANQLNIPSAVGTGIPPDQEPGVQAGTMEDMLAGPDLPHVIPHDAEADAAPNLVPNYLPVIFSSPYLPHHQSSSKDHQCLHVLSFSRQSTNTLAFNPEVVMFVIANSKVHI